MRLSDYPFPYFHSFYSISFSTTVGIADERDDAVFSISCGAENDLLNVKSHHRKLNARGGRRDEIDQKGD